MAVLPQAEYSQGRGKVDPADPPIQPKIIPVWIIFRLGRIMPRIQRASWFETRGVATLLTMRAKTSSEVSDLRYARAKGLLTKP
jgi:hypothetical protein